MKITLTAIAFALTQIDSRMNPDDQFWWNWAATFAGVIVNLLVVLVALFGERFWHRAFPPVLRMQLVEPLGEKTVAHLLQNGTTTTVDVRFFHLKVWNDRRKWSPAHSVQVYLTSIEEIAPNGNFQQTWAGNVPMRWRDQEFTSITQTLGAPKDSDLLMVGKQGLTLSLMPLLAPNNLAVNRQGQCRFIARLQIRSNETDSEDFRIQVSWDGVWEDGDTEMGKHLRVEMLTPPPDYHP